MAQRQQSGPVPFRGRFPAISERTARRSIMFVIVLGVAYLSGHLFPLMAAGFIAWRLGK